MKYKTPRKEQRVEQISYVFHSNRAGTSVALNYSLIARRIHNSIYRYVFEKRITVKYLDSVCT